MRESVDMQIEGPVVVVGDAGYIGSHTALVLRGRLELHAAQARRLL